MNDGRANLQPSATRDALRVAIERGHTKTAVILLKYGKVDPIKHDKIQLAAQLGRTEIVKAFLESKSQDAVVLESLNSAIIVAARESHLDIVKLILKDSRISKEYYFRKALRSLVQIGNMDALKIPLDLKPSFSSDAMLWAIYEDKVDVVRYLIQERKFDPSQGYNRAVKLAATQKRAEILSELLKDPRVDPGVDNNFAIISAAQFNAPESVKILLQDPRVLKAGNLGMALDFSVVSGNLETLKILLASPAVDPTWNNYVAIKTAAQRGHFEMIQELVADSRVNLENLFAGNYDFPRNYNGKLIQWGSKIGNIKIVEFFAKKTSPAVMDNSAIKLASQEGHVEIVEFLLADPRVDASANNNQALKLASETLKEKIEWVSKVFENTNIPESQRNVLQLAITNPYYQIIGLLHNDAKVKALL